MIFRHLLLCLTLVAAQLSGQALCHCHLHPAVAGSHHHGDHVPVGPKGHIGQHMQEWHPVCHICDGNSDQPDECHCSDASLDFVPARNHSTTRQAPTFAWPWVASIPHVGAGNGFSFGGFLDERPAFPIGRGGARALSGIWIL